MSCLHCTAEVSNGLALCERCTMTLRTTLVNVGAYYGDVERIQPGQRVKVRSAYQSTPPPATSPRVDPISVALTAAANTLSTWCRTLADDRPTGNIPSSTTTQAGWLESHVSSIVTLEWAAQILIDVLADERSLKRILDRSDTGWYAGVCGNEIGREETEDGTVEVTCPRGLYGNGTSWVTCPECGRSWDAGARREVMRHEAEDQLAPVRVLAAVIVGIEDEQVSVEKLTRQIENWITRKRLRDYGVRVLVPGQEPRRVYRIGDVLALVRTNRTKRNDEAC